MVDPIARFIAAAGLVTAVASLCLTAYLWYRSGARLRVIAKLPVGTTTVVVEVVNIGRLAANVRRIELRDHFVLLSATGTNPTRPTSRWAIELATKPDDGQTARNLPYDLAPSAFLRADIDVNTVLAKADGAPDVAVAAWAQRGDGRWYVSEPLKVR